MLITIESDTAEAEQLLDRLSGRLTRSTPLLRELAREMHDYQSEVFETAGQGQWAPLHPKTVQGKGSSRILVDTGSLLADLTGRSGDRFTADSVQIGTNHPAAAFLERGARGMPVRDPVPPPPPHVVRQWSATFLRGLTEGIGAP